MDREFLESLAQCQLLSEDQCRQFAEKCEAQGRHDSKGQAQLAVDEGLLTVWQAKQLLAGNRRLALGKYQLVDQLGVGRVGRVYKAVHSGLKTLVALKVMDDALVEDQEQMARFKREAQIAATLSHPNIIRAYDAESDGDMHFWVAEYVEGKDLEKWLEEQGTLPVRWTCECIRQAALALQYAHERGLVHRDIKPNNLLVTASDTNSKPNVKIVDFGVAFLTSLAKESARLTDNMQTLGTIDYIAPEQAKSSRTADIRADIFSLGCTLFKLLTGELPFPGKTSLQRLVARSSTDAPTIRSVKPDLPEGLDAVVAKMLAREKEDRYATPGEVAEALAPFAWPD